MFHLIVVHEIPGHAKGARITNQDEVARILAGNLAPSVVKVAATAEEPIIEEPTEGDDEA